MAAKVWQKPVTLSHRYPINATLEANPMTMIFMPRKKISFRIDEVLIDGMREEARDAGDSANRWLEKLLYRTLKECGRLDPNYRYLGETRGGNRTPGSSDDE